jgi:hypothetical protein
MLLVTLTVSKESQEIFRSTTLTNNVIDIKTIRAKTDSTQCYNFQYFGHIWVQCHQLPKYLWHLGEDRQL